LRRRGDPDEKVRQRLAIADAEEAKGRAIADHVVVNDELDRAVAEVAGIFEKWRSARPA
jgi:guanylate kinase